MQAPERKIIFVDFLQQHPVIQESTQMGPIRFNIQKHGIGWDYKTAETIIRNYDGYADGFAIGGLFKYLGYQEPKTHHPGYIRMIRSATRTPVYVADDFRNFFSEWTLKKLLQDHPQIFYGKKVLFQCASAAAILPQIEQAGAEILAADPLLISGIPLLLRGTKQIQFFLGVLRPVLRPVLFNLVQPVPDIRKSKAYKTILKWIEKSDVLAGFGNMLPLMESYELLAGKLLLIDYISPKLRESIEKAGVSQIVEFLPQNAGTSSPTLNRFPILEAVIDQTRIFESSPLNLQDYLLKWLERTRLSPKPMKSAKGIRRKCAFIFHALTQDDLWRVPPTRIFKNTPQGFRDLAEKSISYLPCFYVGKLTGAVSEATGQEVECDFYGMPATPRGILNMDEEFLYKRLVQCVELAKSRGAGMVGLGAYTKVAGDAGVTVSKRSSIPVTNGNSYSAATTLWAARQMVEKLGLISPEKVGNRFKAKAMIIGATGSIGRVSSLLVSLVFQEVVLIANRADKLLELREEILKLSPGIHVTINTHSDLEIPDADLVVTATSNQSGSVLDINLVKPGAVICDCSRPLDITQEEAAKRPDVLVIESGEVLLPGNVKMDIDIGLPSPSVYACTAETVLLAMEGRFESFSLSKQLSLEKTKEIYKLGVKHGARLSAIQGPLGLITDQQIEQCRAIALERLKYWKIGGSRVSASLYSLKTDLKTEKLYESQLLQPSQLYSS